MNFKKFTLTLAAMLVCVGLYAQPQSKSDESVEFRPHWDLQLQGGVGHTIGETTVGKLMSPAVVLSTNYRFHHAMGVRFGLGGWQGKGAVVCTDDNYSFNFIQLNADYKLDLSALIGGYNHKRPVSVYALAGVGFNYGFDNKQAQSLVDADKLEYLWDKKAFVAGRFGLGVDFRVAERVSLNLEANANILSDRFNSKKAENVDWQFNYLVGVSYSFGKKHQTSKVWAAEQEALKRAEEARIEAERVAAEKAAEEAAKAEAARVAAEKLAKEEAAKAEAARVAAAVRAQNIADNSQNVFFAIGSTYVRKAELEKITRIAEWLKNNPDYTVAVVGYADKETGTASGNMKLSERRAQNVKKALLAAGVEEARIELDHKGDTVQPFEKAAENRVVICTLE
ncbi:MAG: OmpA family protein [Alistipes sp.]|nr:OmpA family protein [Alistipes sp.]